VSTINNKLPDYYRRYKQVPILFFPSLTNILINKQKTLHTDVKMLALNLMHSNAFDIPLSSFKITRRMSNVLLLHFTMKLQ
ncbi:hypothetical protein L9F63_002806, partial [Diploptera punctata]